MSQNHKLVVALVISAVALVLTVDAVTVKLPAFATLAAVVAGGAAWFFRELFRETAERRRVCESYAAVIAIQYQYIRSVLADDEIDRWAVLAPRIARGFEPESFGKPPREPYPLLADAEPFLHLLGSKTIGLLTRWHYMDADILSLWEDLGTKQISALGPERVGRYYGEMKAYRAAYRDWAYSALLALREEGVDIQNILADFTADGARDVREELRTG